MHGMSNCCSNVPYRYVCWYGVLLLAELAALASEMPSLRIVCWCFVESGFEERSALGFEKEINCQRWGVGRGAGAVLEPASRVARAA